jgi:octaprenyl-diphosphate synthase
MQSFNIALQQRNFIIFDILIDLTQRMVEGELIPLTFNGNRRITEADVLDIAKRKTAYLFAGCARIGAILGKVDENREEALARYGLKVGLAFQIVDDMLDFSSSEKVLGKPVGSDLREGKITLPLIYVLDVCTRGEAKSIETVLQEKDFKSVTRSKSSPHPKIPDAGKLESLLNPLREARKLFNCLPSPTGMPSFYPRIILEREK